MCGIQNFRAYFVYALRTMLALFSDENRPVQDVSCMMGNSGNQNFLLWIIWIISFLIASWMFLLLKSVNSCRIASEIDALDANILWARATEAFNCVRHIVLFVTITHHATHVVNRSIVIIVLAQYYAKRQLAAFANCRPACKSVIVLSLYTSNTNNKIKEHYL